MKRAKTAREKTLICAGKLAREIARDLRTALAEERNPALTDRERDNSVRVFMTRSLRLAVQLQHDLMGAP